MSFILQLLFAKFVMKYRRLHLPLCILWNAK